MKTHVYSCIILFIFLITVRQVNGDMSVVKPPANIPQKGLLSVVSNEKYGLDCIFYGSQVVAHDINDTIAGETDVINDILIYERASSRYKMYEPLRDPSASFIKFNESVWSPNDEYFVLAPSGVVGFQVLHSSHVLEQINDEEGGFVRVFMSGENINAPDLHFWHTFWKWVGDDAFLFTVTHAYDHNPFIYEIGARKLFALAEGARVFTAMTEHGEVAIEEKKDFTMLDDRDLTKVEVGMTRGIVLLRCGEPASPHHLPVWIYPSEEGYYHYMFYFWPTNDVELPADVNDGNLRLVAITKVTLEDRGYVSDKPSVKQETYVFPEQVKGKIFTGLKGYRVRRYEK